MKPYKDPKRLADVMALIQVLSESIFAISTVNILTEQLRDRPTSAAPQLGQFCRRTP